MSEQLFYLAMDGLDAAMRLASSNANNLANRGTTAFKAQRPVFASLPIYGQGLPDRVAVATREEGADLRAGPIEETGRNLDVAVSGPGWIAVQASDGTVALTRNGALSISSLGVLQTNTGNPVLGQGSTPIVLPPLQKVTIGEDGTISGTPIGQSPDQIATLNRIVLTNPPAASLSRRADGLFEATGAGVPTPDGNVRLQTGALEDSNAEPVSLMLNMIENSRLYEMETELMRTALNFGQGQSSPLTLT
jgi:flagellar basal-body rod protein FlgF